MSKGPIFAVLLSITALLLIGCGSGDGDAAHVLRFTAIPDQNTTDLAERFAPLATYLSEELDVPVEYVPSRDYQASVEMFRNGDVQLAWFGGLTGVQARHAVEGARAIAQGEDDPEYYSYFIAHESTGLTESDDFPAAIGDLAFTFGSESSTSGRLMPEHFITRHTGLAPTKFFSKPFGFSGSHDKTCELVESGRFEAGVVNFKVYDRRVKRRQTDPDVCRVIWRTPTYADYNFTAHPDLDAMFGDGFIDRLQWTLIDISDPTLLEALPRENLIPIGNGEFDEIEAVARELGMLR
jgi:phosphonate transport system substrate-binding protein